MFFIETWCPWLWHEWVSMSHFWHELATCASVSHGYLCISRGRKCTLALEALDRGSNQWGRVPWEDHPNIRPGKSAIVKMCLKNSWTVVWFSHIIYCLCDYRPGVWSKGAKKSPENLPENLPEFIPKLVTFFKKIVIQKELRNCLINGLKTRLRCS